MATVKQAARMLGKMGGDARKRALTPARIRAIALKASNAAKAARAKKRV